MRAMLITQCLQNDFVKPIGRLEPLPNLLHVGHDEARRLLGENPSEGPLERAMQWAYAQPPHNLAIVHIRDWHDADDPGQRDHLEHFGRHCLRGTDGAHFAFSIPDGPRDNTQIIEASGLNDFIDTNLGPLLDAAAAGQRGTVLHVGLVGVWTEAKITFLAYELRTRYPSFRIAVCSALTASASRAQHFVALDQMRNLLGVQVFDSIAGFTEFLGRAFADATEAESLPPIDPHHPQVSGTDLGENDGNLVRYLFRDCRSVALRPLSGGYSGNIVLESDSVDLHGQHQVPHVVKIGPVAPIGRERTAFERIESVLGNAAPRVADFADLRERGAIKYRYAAMGGGGGTTFRRRYQAGLPHRRVARYLRAVFDEQLGRLYAAATREKCNLLEYYAFNPSSAPRVTEKVETVLAAFNDRGTPWAPSAFPRKRGDWGIAFPGGRQATDPAVFYSKILRRIKSGWSETHYMAYVHGDLNGENIVIDGHDNVWIIDFFHTHRGHVIRDLVKLENDLLYIFTPINGVEALDEALTLTDALMEVRDLSRPLATARHVNLRSDVLVRAWDTLRLLRAFYRGVIKEDVDPLQLWIAQLRYAVHTLSFDESNRWQRLWALYTAARTAEAVATRTCGA